MPARGVYRWKGEIVKEAEVLLIAKANRQRFADIEKRVEELHSYETPEIISIPLAEISAGYKEFLADLLGG